MATATRNVRFVQGDSKKLHVPITNTNGEPLNLSGVQAVKYRVGKKLSTTAQALVDKALGTGVAITDAVSGIIEVTFQPADTAELKGEYFHELELIDATGQVMTAFQGKLTLDPALIP